MSADDRSIAPDAAEAQVGHRGLDRLGLASGRPVAQAVVGRTQVRAALHDVARELLAGPANLVALVRRFDPRVDARPGRAATRMGHLVRVARRVVVRRPLPDVAGHVEEAEAVWPKAADRRRSLVAILREVLPRELALPGVRHVDRKSVV